MTILVILLIANSAYLAALPAANRAAWRAWGAGQPCRYLLLPTEGVVLEQDNTDLWRLARGWVRQGRRGPPSRR